MDTTIWILIAVALIAAAIIGATLAVSRTKRRRTSHDLRRQFGPEYDRLVAELGNARAAEAELGTRLQRTVGAAIRPLAPADQARFFAQWNAIQARVIEAPTKAVVDAERLLEEALAARGYSEMFAERIALLSVWHPDLLADYRDAHAVAVESLAGRANTEACRQALLRYRRLFEAVLVARDDSPTRARLDLRDRSSVPAAASDPALR